MRSDLEKQKEKLRFSLVYYLKNEYFINIYKAKRKK